VERSAPTAPIPDWRYARFWPVLRVRLPQGRRVPAKGTARAAGPHPGQQPAPMGRTGRPHDLSGASVAPAGGLRVLSDQPP